MDANVIRRFEGQKTRRLPAFGGARGDQGLETLRHANLLTFPPSHLLALHRLTF